MDVLTLSHLVNLISYFTPAPNNLFVSVDVPFLFTKVSFISNFGKSVDLLPLLKYCLSYLIFVPRWILLPKFSIPLALFLFGMGFFFLDNYYYCESQLFSIINNFVLFHIQFPIVYFFNIYLIIISK